MQRLLVFLGMTAGSWVGWVAGQKVGGFFGAWMLSMVGLGLGLYLGRRIARDHF